MKFLKYSAIATGAFLVIAVGFFFYSIYKLPDPIALKESLKREESKKFEPQNEIQKEVSKEIEALSESIAQSEPVEKINEKKSDMIVYDLIKEDYQDIRVCENLGRSSSKELNMDIIGRALDGSDREDPAVESVRFSMRHIFQSKPVRELFSEIESIDTENLKGEERISYLNKIGFYAMAANKVREIYSQKSEYEEIGDRAFHLYLISKIASEKPELIKDKNFVDFCTELETSMATKTKTDIDEERKEVLKLIEYAGMTPQQLGFNPAIRTKFEVSLNKKGISMGFAYPGMKF